MATDFKTILNLTVPVIVQIGKRDLPMSEVLSLSPGSILELTKTSDEDLDLLVNNKPIAAGAAVKVGENFGIRINHLQPVRDRAQAAVGSQ